MVTHSSVLAWRILGTVEPDGLPSMGSHRVGHDRSDLAAAADYTVFFFPFFQQSNFYQTTLYEFKNASREFPGSPAVGTVYFHC